MSDITVRTLGVDDWEQYRSVRLTALQDSPGRLRRHPRRGGGRARGVLARPDGALDPADRRARRPTRRHRQRRAWPTTDQPDTAQLFGLWVHPDARGTGVATALVRAGAQSAAEAGKRQLHYWVGTDNGRAVAFASGFGFRPTAERRPMRVVSEDDGEEELAMTLPLAGDRGGHRPVLTGPASGQGRRPGAR